METRELCQPIGITPSHQPANRNFTLAHNLCLAWSGENWPPPPHLPVGSTQGEGPKSSTRQSLTDGIHGCPVVPRCPWNLVTLAFQGCVQGQLVQRDQAAIAVDLRIPTRWARLVTARWRCAVWSYSERASGLVAHRLTNIQASRNQSAQQVSQNPFCTLYTVESDSASSMLSHCVLVVYW